MMKHKHLGVISLLLFTGMFLELRSMSNAGFNMTGAPGEGDCSGCHGGTANSDVNGSVRIKVIGDPVKYVPGATYDVQVTTAYAGRSKFGFGLNARMVGKFNAPIGTLAGSNDMQVSSEFITHTNASNKGTDSKTWSFTWKAPEDGTEAITLYAAGLATNNDNTNSGDKVYTHSYMFQKPSANSLDEMNVNSFMHLFPNPTQGVLHINGKASMNGPAEITLFDQNGKEVHTINKEVMAGDYHIELEVPTHLPMGVYHLVLKQADSYANKKFVLQ